MMPSATMTQSLQEFYTVFSFYLFVSSQKTHFAYLMQGDLFDDLDKRADACLTQGWFIFTFLMLICTLKSTVAFFFLFFMLDLAFLMLGIGYLDRVDGAPNTALIKAGGYFGIFSAFAAWYNALAGILDRSNSFFLVPVAHFPWSAKGRERRGKVTKEEHSA